MKNIVSIFLLISSFISLADDLFNAELLNSQEMETRLESIMKELEDKREAANERIRLQNEAKQMEEEKQYELMLENKKREQEYRNSDAYKEKLKIKNAEDKKRLKAETKCAKDSASAKTEFSASTIYWTCMQNEGY